jgi:hypothetical protein
MNDTRCVMNEMNECMNVCRLPSHKKNTTHEENIYEKDKLSLSEPYCVEKILKPKIN